MNLDEFLDYGKQMVDFVANYRSNIDNYPVRPEVEPRYIFDLLPSAAPEEPEDFSEVLKELESVILPGVLQWAHPKFFAYFPSGFSYPCILGDMLSSAASMSAFSWKSAPISAELEQLMLDWYGIALGFPEQFLNQPTNGKGGGVIQGSASDSVFCCMMAARYRAQERLNTKQRFQSSDYIDKLVAYASKEAHSCSYKAANMCCVKFRALETDEKNSLTAETVQNAMRADVARGLEPFYITITIGTTGTGAIDQVCEIVEVCKEFPNVWLHIDGAYALNVAICPEHREEYAPACYDDINSISVNPYKMIGVTVGAACMWCTDMDQFCKPFLTNPSYLKYHEKGAMDHRNYGSPLSRRFRSLKLWFHFRSYGLEGIRNKINKIIDCAIELEDLVKTDDRFEIAYPRCVSLINFRYIKPETLVKQNVLNLMINTSINKSNDIIMTQVRTQGKQVLRMAVCYDEADSDQMKYAWETVQKHTDLIESGEHSVTKRDTRVHLDIVPVPDEMLRTTSLQPVEEDFGPMYIPQAEFDELFKLAKPDPKVKKDVTNVVKTKKN